MDSIETPTEPRTTGQLWADRIAAVVGSWRFILIQSVLLLIWIVFNCVPGLPHFDAYPFILLNLALSFQAAFTAPIIMMAGNRQSEIDRLRADMDLRIDMKAESGIEEVNRKLDAILAKGQTLGTDPSS